VFDTKEEVLRAARAVAAVEVAREPHVRATLRALYYRRATVSHAAHRPGRLEVDAASP
jgi:transcriptional accessory protein Tex/SPT6